MEVVVTVVTGVRLTVGDVEPATIGPVTESAMLVASSDAPGLEIDAAAVTVIVAGDPKVTVLLLVGKLMPTDGAALIETVTLVETPRLPKLSVTSALSV